MVGLPLTFAAPLALAILAALPLLWLLLRLTPPPPRRIDFPPLKIAADLMPHSETPVRTPWWLLLLRLLLVSMLIFAAAGPVWNAKPVASTGGPLLLLVDNGATAAHDWGRMQDIARARIEEAGRANRSVALVALADPQQDFAPMTPVEVLERVQSMAPVPHLADRAAVGPALAKFLAAETNAEIVWISDGVTGRDGQVFARDLAGFVGGRNVTVYKHDRAAPLAISSFDDDAAAMAVQVVRAEANGRNSGSVLAIDAKGAVLADAPFSFAVSGGTNTLVARAQFSLPLELRNAIARFEIANEHSAAAVYLVDGHGKRQRTGIVTGDAPDQAQPLLTQVYYIERALSPYTELRVVRGATADAVRQLLEANVSVLFLADIGALDETTRLKLAEFVESGGMLVRFSGPRMAAGNDDLVPVRLRRGGRMLGGVLSWDAPKTLAPFSAESPFHDLVPPGELTVTRQILAEPDAELTARTWAALSDGTPIVTAVKRGKGRIVLFHVTADPRWSNLPLTGLFVDMLKQVVSMSGKMTETEVSQPGANAMLPPRLALDGFGILAPPPSWASGIPGDYRQPADRQHPAGFYGTAEMETAVNVLTPETVLQPLDFSPLRADIVTESLSAGVDLRAALLIAALLLFLADLAISLFLGGHWRAFGLKGGVLQKFKNRSAVWGMLTVLIAGFLLNGFPGDAAAQEVPPSPPVAKNAAALPPVKPGSYGPALTARLAYVKTGNRRIDDTSRAGLSGLSQQLSLRTSFDPAEPNGVDPATDELDFYPLLYWPIDAAAALPGEVALRKLDAFLKNGGTIVFDTRDALNDNGSGMTPEAQYLKRLLAAMDVPGMEPVPPDHVLTKSFYLLNNFQGRYVTGRTFVEALPPKSEEADTKGPVRGGDGVSPVIILSNDLAAAWAVDEEGVPLYPVLGADRRQREYAFRAGINIVMYVLTGNYKSDQVHVPALLERLGQ